MENIKTVLADLPASIGGYTVLKDDYYTIVLNQNLSHEKNYETYLHEMGHIKNKDFEKKCSIDLIEVYAHRR